MSQDKFDPIKSGAGKPGPDASTDAQKRPYATLDLKATEVAAAKMTGDQPEAATNAAGGTKPGDGLGMKSSGAAAGSASTTTATGSAKPTPAGGTSSGPAAPQKPATGPAPKLPPAAVMHVWVPSLVAGAAGAALTLLGLGSMGLIGGDSMSGGLPDRLAALEKSVSARPAGASPRQLVEAEARLAAVEASARDLAQAQAAFTADAKALDTRLAGQTPNATAAAERVQKLEQQLADLAAAATNDPQRGRIPALAQITTKLGDLDTQIATRAGSLRAELSQEFEKRLTTSTETMETARARLALRTQSLEQTLKSVSDDTTALRATVDGLKGDLDARFKTTAKPADLAAAVEPVTTKVAALEKNLANVVRSEQDRNATAGNILLSIELANLKRTVDRGGKYATELAAVKKVGGDKLNLAVLESAQTTGVPSLAGLTTEFRALAYTMLDAEAEPEQGSVMDRLLASAKSVVRVRKVVHAQDDKSTEAIVARMEEGLKEGRLGDVLDQSKKLNEKPLAVAAPWLKKIEARYAIETAVADLEQSLKTALAGSADAKKGAN